MSRKKGPKKKAAATRGSAPALAAAATVQPPPAPIERVHPCGCDGKDPQCEMCDGTGLIPHIHDFRNPRPEDAGPEGACAFPGCDVILPPPVAADVLSASDEDDDDENDEGDQDDDSDEDDADDVDEDLDADADDDGPARLSLDELRAIGAVLAESPDGDSTDVVTRGGRKLRFPRDEELAATLSRSDLTGEAPEKPSVAGGHLQPRSARDLEAMGVVISKREEDGKVHVVTRGGQKCVFPGDEVRAAQMTDSQLSGESPAGFPRVNAKTSLLGKPIKG